MEPKTYFGNLVGLLSELKVRQRDVKIGKENTIGAMLHSLSNLQIGKAHTELDLAAAWIGLDQMINTFFSHIRETPLTYVFNTWFLKDVIHHLTPRRPEEICYLTGDELGPIKITSRICPIISDEQSIAHARGNPRSCSDALIEILNHGLSLHVMAHSHPGGGAVATTPSPTDVEYLGRIQRNGADAIGLIVTRDQFVRFFSVEKLFQVLVLGYGATQVEEHVYRIVS